MNSILKQTWYLTKNISKKTYFWPLVGLMFLGIILDIHSTYLFVTELGLWEKSRWVVYLFYQFFLPTGLGLGVGPAILLAMVVAKIILLVAVAVALFLIVLATKGNQAFFKTSFVLIFVGSAYNLFVGIWNYYHYFSGIMGQ